MRQGQMKDHPSEKKKKIEDQRKKRRPLAGIPMQVIAFNAELQQHY